MSLRSNREGVARIVSVERALRDLVNASEGYLGGDDPAIERARAALGMSDRVPVPPGPRPPSGIYWDEEIVEMMRKAGWRETATGGGCEAWTKPSTCDGGYMMLTDDDGCDFPKVGHDALLGFYDEEGQSTGSYLRFPYLDLLTGKVRIS